MPIGIGSRALSSVRMVRPFLAAAALFAATGQAHAITVDFTFLGTFTTPSLSTGGVTATGSADINVLNGNGLGIVGGTVTTHVDFPEFITFSFDSPSVTDVELGFPAIGGLGTANSGIEAFQPGGASLGTQTLDLFGITIPWDVSALFGDVPLESVTLSPLNTNLSNQSTTFTISSISFVPEPSTAPSSLWGSRHSRWVRGEERYRRAVAVDLERRSVASAERLVRRRTTRMLCRPNSEARALGPCRTSPRR